MTELEPSSTPGAVNHSRFRLWYHIVLFGAVVFLLFSLYLFLRGGSYDLFTVNQTLANTAVVLIGLSFALSGLNYFWNFAAGKIIYRKHLGVVGFIIGLFHFSFIFLILRPIFPWPQFYLENLPTILAALVALILFGFLTAIGNRYAIGRLGGQKWRKLMRYLGYTGLVSLMIHFSLNQWLVWKFWFENFQPVLPPLSLLSIIFVLAVILLRLALWLALSRKKHQATELSSNV